jgi:hypothetical protein
MLVLVALGDLEPIDRIQGVLIMGLMRGSPLILLIGSTSTKNLDGFATQDCKSQRMVHWIAS